MNPAKRRTVIAGNWKMNFTPAEATAFINEIKPMVAGKDNCDIVFCAPYVSIAAAMVQMVYPPLQVLIPTVPHLLQTLFQSLTTVLLQTEHCSI